MELWKTKNNLICDRCGSKQKRRIMSPFLSFTSDDTDWLAEIRIPEVKGNTYMTGKINICPLCFRELAHSLFMRSVHKTSKKSGTQKTAEQLHFFNSSSTSDSCLVTA